MGADLVDDGAHRAFDGCSVADVAVLVVRAVEAAGLDPLRQRGGFVVLHVDERDAGALLGEPLDERLADAGGAPADEHDAVAQARVPGAGFVAHSAGPPGSTTLEVDDGLEPDGERVVAVEERIEDVL